VKLTTGLELAYFFCSSTSPQQRREHFQTLLKLYYNQFCEELKSLGDKAGEYFTYDALLEDFDECYPFGFIMGCVHSQVKCKSQNIKACVSIIY